MGQVKIRLTGLPEDVEAVAELLRQKAVVLEESGDYRNRKSEFVHRYLTVGSAELAAHENPDLDAQLRLF